MIGMAHRKIAFPIAWTAVPSEGGCSSEDQVKVLTRFLQESPPADIKAVFGDPEFISAE